MKKLKTNILSLRKALFNLCFCNNANKQHYKLMLQLVCFWLMTIDLPFDSFVRLDLLKAKDMFSKGRISELILDPS